MRKLHTWLYALVAIIVLAMPAHTAAQTILNNTTTSSAITKDSPYVTLASISNISAGDYLWFSDQPELVRIQVVPTTGTTLTIARGIEGTHGTPHATSAIVFTGPARRFKSVDPDWGATCIRSTIEFLPWINVNNGKEWSCGFLGNSATSALNWRSYSNENITYQSIVKGELVPSPPSGGPPLPGLLWLTLIALATWYATRRLMLPALQS